MRRNVTKVAAVLVILMPIVLIVLVGIVFLRPPLKISPWLRLTAWESLSEEGHPIRFVVTAPHRDAWTRLHDRPVGAVYARRVPGTYEVRVLSALHKFGVPHDYNSTTGVFDSRCFVVHFDVDGKVLTDDVVKASQYEDIASLPARVVDDDVLIQWPTD
jgi:hypothetical protein